MQTQSTTGDPTGHEVPRLPLDIVHEIIDALAEFPTADAFAYEPDVLATLTSLCRVSKDVGRRATFHLYSCISVRPGYPGDQVACLLSTGLPHRSLTHTLVVGIDVDSAESELDVVNLVRRLAPTLTRLMLSAEGGRVPSGPFDEFVLRTFDVSQVLVDLPVVRDLVIMRFKSEYLDPDLADPDQWLMPLLSGLRRLTLDGVELSYGIPSALAFLRRCPDLETLAITWYNHYPMEEATKRVELLGLIWSAIKALHSLKNIVLFYAQPQAATVREVSNPYHDRVSIMDVCLAVNERSVMTWIDSNARTGALWTLDGTVWPPPQTSP